MKIFIENFDNKSDSGPNGFTRKLISSLTSENEITLSNYEDADISFCLIESGIKKIKPRVLRLDGIYFNIQQDFQLLNSRIKETFKNSDSVVYQTNFNKALTEKWFGNHSKSFVIRNGTDVQAIKKISPVTNQIIDRFAKVWSCASSWRPHKRLGENIEYFLQHAPNDACLIVMGKGAENWLVSHPRIFYAGHVSWENQISVYKRSEKFIHLAWLDHCPNVVVDARASGCHIVCSSSGGTKEISGLNSTIIKEDDWDFEPVKLYEPPKLDFSKINNQYFESEIEITKVSREYLNVFRSVL